MKLQDRKRISAILFFAGKSPNYTINRLKLMKLLWLSDRIHLNRYGRMILRDKYCALPHGPVPSITMDFSKNSRDDQFEVKKYNITAEDRYDSSLFSQSDIDVMNEVWEEFGLMNQFNLAEYSHQFPEWRRYKKKLEGKSAFKSYPMKINDFFIAPLEKTPYEFNSESTRIAKEIFNSHNAVLDALSE